MLLEINKKLLRNNLRSKHRLQSVRQLQNFSFDEWLNDILYRQTEDKNQQAEEISLNQLKQRKIFLIQNFDNLVKKKKLIELFFYVWAQNITQLQKNLSSQHKINDKQQQTKLYKAKKNFAHQAKQFLIEIIRYNPRLNKELYHIIQSNSQLGQIYLKPSHYKVFYSLIIQIDQEKNPLQNHKNKTGKSWQFFIDQLTFWWSITKDYLITTKYCYLRYNLLAFFIQNANKQELMSFQEGTLIARISSGIQKRLVQPKYRQAAILIWTKLIKLLDLASEITIQQKAQYFEIEQLNSQIIELNKSYDNNDLPDKEAVQNENLSSLNTIDNNKQMQNQVNNMKENQVSDKGDDNLEQDQFVQVKIKAPKTLQDCILALQNPLRRDIGLKQLKKLIKKQQDDIIFVWKSLLRCLLHPLTQSSGQILKDLFVKRPTQWIEDVSQMFFKKDADMNEKINLIECIEAGINQLSQNPTKSLQQPQEKGDFYFKRVASRYFTEKPVINSKPQPQSRRWGHTRIAYQESLNKKSQTIASLLIVSNNDPYMNRLYPIITQLLFKIIIKLLPQSKKSYLTNYLLTQRNLNLLGTVAHNIKNYFDKYLILQEILLIVQRVLSYIQSEFEKQKKQSPIMNSQMNWNAKSVSSVVISCIQVLNKVSLSLDKYLPDLMLINLKDCVQKLKRIDIYGIRPLVEMLQANIYNKIN